MVTSKVIFPNFTSEKETTIVAQTAEIITFPKIEYDIELLADEAYDWLLKEMPKNGKYPKFILNDLGDFYTQYGIHLALFRKKGYKTYLRFYRPEKDLVSYVELDNFERVSRNSASLTNYLVKNGVYAYLYHMDPERCRKVFNMK